LIDFGLAARCVIEALGDRWGAVDDAVEHRRDAIRFGLELENDLAPLVSPSVVERQRNINWGDAAAWLGIEANLGFAEH
jgi:hypothetical protein